MLWVSFCYRSIATFELISGFSGSESNHGGALGKGAAVSTKIGADANLESAIFLLVILLQDASQTGGYALLYRTLRSGDTIEIKKLPIRLNGHI
jgi:hypothetical protein